MMAILGIFVGKQSQKLSVKIKQRIYLCLSGLAGPVNLKTAGALIHTLIPWGTSGLSGYPSPPAKKRFIEQLFV
jgi:hypothetical protein